MSELFLQLDLFANAARRPEPVCTGCGRSEAEAPAYVINDLGRFCPDCESLAFSWPPAGSGGGGPYFHGGPDHSKPWRNPALDGGGKP